MSIKLFPNDSDEGVEVPKDICKKSAFLNSKIDSGEEEIKLEDINTDILDLVVAYLKRIAEKDPSQIKQVLGSDKLQDEVDADDYEFIKDVSYENCFHLINAGVLLELEHLHDLACAKIACFMKGKTPEQVNKEFTIECQLTQDEAKELGLNDN